MIRLENVSKRYRLGRELFTTGLEDVNCTIQKGEFITVIGPSGSGKSTILALIGLIDRATEGEIWLDDQKTSELSERERTRIRAQRLGFIYQFPSLIPTLSVQENVMLPKTLQGKYEAADALHALELLSQVGLMDRKDHLPSQLSGGEQRRVALARAIMGKPDILLADEPTGALDQESARSIMGLFRSLNVNGTTIVLVTHDLSLTSFSSRTIKIEKGRIV